MCGRYVLLKRDVSELMKRLRLEELLNLIVTDSRYNIAPSQRVLTVHAAESGHSLQPEMMSWGWLLAGENISKPNLVINARSETIRQKPAFREAFKTRRCVLLASGFYEWQRASKSVRPYFFQVVNERPFFMAGLWRPNETGGGSCVAITTQANSLMKPLHDRMPVILPTENALEWLSVGPENVDTLGKLFVPYRAEEMTLRGVSSYVNSAKNEGVLCLAAPADIQAEPEQMGFGF